MNLLWIISIILILNVQQLFAQTFSNATVVAIPDNNATGIYSNITVNNIPPTAVVSSVSVNITHPYDGDVDIYLVDPFNNAYDLSTDNGGTGDNYVNTVFSNSGGTSITAGVAPFTGTYIPEAALTTTGISPSGTWKLHVLDDASGDVGQLNSWSITFNVPTCPTVGVYPIINSVTYSFPLTVNCASDYVWIRSNSSTTAGGSLNPGMSIQITPTNSQTTGNNIHGYEQHAGTWYNYWSDLNSPANSNRTFSMYEVDNATSTSLGIELCDVRTDVDMPYLISDATCGGIITSGTWTANDGSNAGATGPSSPPPGTGCQFIPFATSSVKGSATYSCPTCPGGSLDLSAESYGWAYFDPAIAGPGVYDITYRFNNTCTAPYNCDNSTTVRITVTAVNTISLSSAAGTNNQTKCINTAISNITYATVGATGATVSGLPTGVSGSWAGNVVTISGTPSVSGTFNYTVTSSGGCPTVTATGTITVTPNNTISLSSAAGTNAQTVCLNSSITNITYSTVGATGATFSGLPGGVSGSWAGNVATISGSPNTTAGSPFTYTVNLTGGCGTISTTGTITVTPNNTITLNSAAGTNAQAVCLNSAITTISYSTTGATGATISGLPSGVSGSWAGNFVTISGSPNTAVGSPFNYSVTLTGGCGTVTANGTITITPNNTIALNSAAGTDAQTVCLNSGITNITYNTTGATGANVSGLPSGVSGSWAGNLVTISGSPNTTVGSPFTYTVNLTGGCGTITTTGTITVTPNNTITLSSAAGTNAQAVCLNSTIANISYSTTGATGATISGLPAGVTGSWAANTVTISGSPTTVVGSPFTYTITLTGGCGTITANGTINVNPLPVINSVSSTNVTICAGSDGTITINASGTPPFQYSINGGLNFYSNGGSFTGLSNGTYGIAIKDGNGCITLGSNVSISDGGAPAAPVAGTTATYCSGSTLSDLSATASAGGTLTWYSNAGLTTIIGTGTTLTPGNNVGVTNYYVTESAAGCQSAATMVTITIIAPPSANAGTDQSICGNSAIFTGNTAATGTGTWTLISGSGTITAPNSPTSGVTGLGVGANVFEWTINSAPCTPSSDQVTITGVASPTTAIAGSDQTICGGTSTLAGNTATIGTGTWTLVSGTGTVTTPNSPTSGVTGLTVGTNIFQWTIANPPCTSSSDQMSIIITSLPTVADAGIDQSVCGNTATFAANTATIGTGTWSLISGSGTITAPNSPISGVSGLGIGANVFEWTISSPPCTPSSSQVTITGVATPTTANAGSDQTLCGSTTNLAGNTPTVGTGTWTLISGSGTITAASSPTSGITGLAIGVNVFEWTITNAPCASSADQVSITITSTPNSAAAGSDQSVCGTTATLAGNSAATGTGAWTLISGSGIITAPSSPTSGITGLGIGPNIFEWTISSPPCTPSSDQVIITGVASPTTSNAGPDQTLCSDITTLAGNTATIGTGTWIFISGSGTITSPTSPNSGVTGLSAGVNVLQWTIMNAPCTSSSDQVSITISSTPTTAIAGTDHSVCGTTETLAGNTATSGTGIWSLVSGTGTIVTPTSSSSNVTGLGIGANVFEWTISNPPCTPSTDQVTITGVTSPTIANAGLDQTLSYGTSTTTLAGNTATIGTGTWTFISGAGTVTTPSSPTSGITGLGSGLNVFQWTIVNAPCPSSSDTVIINIPELPIEIPTAITPNGDGINDDFEITHIDGFPEISIEIFNRWGDKIFLFEGSGTEYSVSSNRWNGKNGGKELPMGSYVFIVKLGKDKDPVKGVVSIIR